MGCDIHLVLEEKTELGKWVGTNTFQGFDMDKSTYAFWPCSRRNYGLFAALAGVRGDGPEPKGLPDDISDLAALRAYQWNGDGHSHSWISLREAIPIWEAHAHPKEKHQWPTSFWFGVDLDDSKPDDIDRYRLVFWFDN